jgi:hypothetical protein
VVVRNNSAFAVSIDLEALRADGTFLETIGFAAPVAPGATASIAYPPIADSLAHFGISVNSGVAGGSLDIWAALQPLTAPLQPTVRTLQAGYSAARDAAGDFCIVEALSNNAGGFAGSAVFAPGAPADPLVISIQDGVKCLFDSSNRTHVIWYQPGSPGTVMHAQHDGTAWKTEVVASPSSLLPHGPDSPQSDVAFDFGLDGTLFSAWYVDTKTIELATRVSNGTWTVEDIPASPEYGFLAVSGDESGTPHLLTLEFFGNYHLFKGASGWTAEAIAPQFQISDCTNAVMSVAAGVVSFVSNEEDNQFRPTFVRGNSSGWEVTDLGITGLGNISRSADGHAFIAVGNENGQQSTIVIVRDGAVTSSTVPSDARAAGFSANGKAWALVWTDAHAVTAASPADAIATVVFDEQ